MSGDLADRYLAGDSIAELAASYGVDPSTIHRRLRAAGVEPHGHATMRRSRQVLTDRQLRSHFRAGRPIRVIADEHGVDWHTVAARATALGLIAPSDDITDRGRAAAALYDTGMSLPQVADRLGVNPRTVRRWLVAIGHPLRPRGRPAG